MTSTFLVLSAISNHQMHFFNQIWTIEHTFDLWKGIFKKWFKLADSTKKSGCHLWISHSAISTTRTKPSDHVKCRNFWNLNNLKTPEENPKCPYKSHSSWTGKDMDHTTSIIPITQKKTSEILQIGTALEMGRWRTMCADRISEPNKLSH